MVTSQSVDLIKTDYTPKADDCAAKYTSKDTSDGFDKVFEAAKKTHEYDYENASGYLNNEQSYENRESQVRPEQDRQEPVNNTEKIDKETRKTDNTEENIERTSEQKVDEKAQTTEEKQPKSEEKAQNADEKQPKVDEKAQNADNTNKKEPVSDTTGKIMLENAAAKTTAKEVKAEAEAKPDAKDIKAEVKADTKEVKAEAKADAKEVKVEVKADVKEAKPDTKDTKAELKTDIKEAKAEVKEVKVEAKPDTKDTKAEVKADVKEAKAEVKADAKEVKADVKEVKADVKETKPEVKADIKEAKADTKETKTELKTDLKDVKPDTKNTKEVKNNLKAEEVKVTNSAEGQKQEKQLDLNLAMNRQKQEQQKFQQESKVNTASNQSNNVDSGGQKVDLQRTMQFDRILNTKQPNTTQQSVLNQVKQASAQLGNGKSEVTIALKPENLGRVNLNLVSQKGVLTAQITAESQQAREMLTRGMETLRQNLSDQGVNVGRITINVQEPSSTNNNSNFDQAMNKFDQNNGSSQANAQNGKQNNPESGYSETGHAGIDSEEFSNITENDDDKELIHAGLVDYKV